MNNILKIIYIIIMLLLGNNFILQIINILILNIKAEDESSLLYLYKDKYLIFIYILAIPQLLFLFKKLTFSQSILLLMLLITLITLYKMLEKPKLPLMNLFNYDYFKLCVILNYSLTKIGDDLKLYGYTKMIAFINNKEFSHTFSYYNKDNNMNIISNLIYKKNQVVFVIDGNDYFDFEDAFYSMMKKTCKDNEGIIKNIKEFETLYNKIYTNGNFKEFITKYLKKDIEDNSSIHYREEYTHLL